MLSNERANQTLNIKRLLIVAAVCAILVTSVIVVDIVSADHEYELAEPDFTDNFPETLYFYNISEGVTSTIFSFIVDIPVNHSGLTHIVPRELSLIFWFRDITDGSDLSPFIYDVWDTYPLNATFSLSLHDYDRIHIYKDGWWAPSQVTIIINEGLGANIVSFGCAFELALVNTPGDPFDGHEVDVQLAMNVTYSRWWGGLKVNPSQQIVEYDFPLPDDGVAVIQSLEYT
ncbi:MAG: hypothetical protein ACFFBJ_02700 [Promethearchaeota archaeon]